MAIDIKWHNVRSEMDLDESLISWYHIVAASKH